MKRFVKITLLALLIMLFAACLAVGCSCGGDGSGNGDNGGNGGDNTPPLEKIEGELPGYSGGVTTIYGEAPDLDNVIIDGKLDDGLWQDKKWYSSYDTENRVGLSVTATTSDKGLYVAARSKDKTVFWTYRNHFEANTSIQIYIKTDEGSKQFQFDANNLAPTWYKVNARTGVDGKLNSVGEAVGLRAEMFATWEELGFESKPETVYILPVYKHKSREVQSLLTLYPTFMKAITAGFDDYFAFDENGCVSGDQPDATVGDHGDGLGKTNVWSVTTGSDGKETVRTSGEKRLFGQAIFFKNEMSNRFMISARIKANSVTSSKTRAGLLIYKNNIAYRGAAIELSDACYSEGKLHTVILSGYTDYPRSVTATTKLCEVANKSVEGKADDEVDLTLYYDNGKIYYVINGEFVCSEELDYLSNCYLGLYSFNSDATFTNLECTTFDSEQQIAELIGEFAYTVDVESSNSRQVRMTADRICVPKAGDRSVTLDFTCTVGFTVDKLIMTGDDGVEHDITADAIANGKNGRFVLTDVDQNVHIKCFTRSISEQTATVALRFYNPDDGVDSGVLSRIVLTLTGEGVFDRFEINKANDDKNYVAAMPIGRVWQYKTELTGYRSSVGLVNNGTAVSSDMTEPQNVEVIASVIGGTASNDSGSFKVSSNVMTNIWDVEGEENSEIYFQTTNNQHSYLYFSGKTVSEYQVAYVEITNQTDPLAFTSLERDPAVGFVIKNSQYSPSMAMLRFAGLRIVPGGTPYWASKTDTGNIFAGYTGYDISTTKGVIDGEPILTNGNTVNRLSYNGREDTTSFLMIRMNSKLYFYVADKSQKALPTGENFDKLTYLYEFDHEFLGGEAAIGIGATVSYNLRIKFSNYWILSGDEAKAYAEDIVTSEIVLTGERTKIDVDAPGMYEDSEGALRVCKNTTATVTAKADLPKNEILKVTLGGQSAQYVAAGESASFKITAVGERYRINARKLAAVSVGGRLKDYDEKLHTGLVGTVYEGDAKVKSFEVGTDGKFSFTVPSGTDLRFAIGKDQYLTHNIDISDLAADTDLGEIEITALPFGGTVKTDADTNVNTQKGYEYSYDGNVAKAHITVDSATNLIHSLALQSEPMTDAVIKFSYSRRSASECGSVKPDEGAMGIGVSIYDGREIASLLFIKKGYRVLGQNNTKMLVDSMNANLNSVDFSPVSVKQTDVMIVKQGALYRMLCKSADSTEYTLVAVWQAGDGENGVLSGKCSFALTFMMSRGMFADMTFFNVEVGALNSITDYPELLATVEYHADNGEISVDQDGAGYISKDANVYTVYKSTPTAVTVTPDEGYIIYGVKVDGKQIKLEGYVEGAHTFEITPSANSVIEAQFLLVSESARLSGSVSEFDGKKYAGITGTLYGAEGALKSFDVSDDGSFSLLVPKSTELWIQLSSGVYMSEKVSAGKLSGDKSVGSVSLVHLPFGGTVRTVGGTNVNTHAAFTYSYDNETGALADIRVDYTENSMFTLALQSEAMTDAVIKFSYSRRSASECGVTDIPDEGAMGLGISAYDGKEDRTLLFIRRGYRVIGKNYAGYAVDQINLHKDDKSYVDFAPVSVKNTDVMVIKRGSTFYMYAKNATVTEYKKVCEWSATVSGKDIFTNACNFSISFYVNKATFVDMSFSNVSVEQLDESKYSEFLS